MKVGVVWVGDKVTTNSPGDIIRVTTPATQYFPYEVLKEKGSIDGGISTSNAVLVGDLGLCYALLFLSMYKGVVSSGKSAYANAIFPYIVLLVLLIKCFTLTGAIDGTTFLFIPQWNELLTLSLWYNAITQSCFSLRIGQSAILNCTSFNPFRHDIYRKDLICSKLISVQTTKIP